MRSSVVLLCLAVGGTAWADNKPLVDPARAYADESSVWIESGNGDDGAVFDAGAEIGGLQKNDRVRLDIKQGGKVLASEKCTFASRAMIDGLDGVECKDRSKTFKKPGAYQADLIVESDADDKQYLVRTFNVNLKKWGTPEWQIDGDDLLGPAYIVQNKDQEPQILFWASAGTSGGAPTLTCKVDGKPIPEVEGDWDDVHGFSADIIKGTKRTTWTWHQIRYHAADDAHHVPMKPEKHPGAWDCLMRDKGTLLREFKFTVDAKGKVQPHPMQSAKGAPTLAPGVVQIDMIIPKGNGWDQRIKPDAIKKSRGFGMPWQQDDSVKTLLAALPAAYENASPVVDQKKAAGKVIDGAKATPPRFVDESTTWIRLSPTNSSSNKGGYSIIAHAVVANVNFAKGNVFHLLWKQKGKVLADADCGWSRGEEKNTKLNLYGMENATALNCQADADVTAAGPIEAQLMMSDDTDGNEYLLRTYNVTVVHPKSYGDPLWAILPDDELGSAWIAGLHPDAEHIIFRFWMANEKWPDTMRCTVDGKKVANDIYLTGGPETQDWEYVLRKQNGDDKKYHYTLFSLDSGTQGEYLAIAPGLPKKDDYVVKDKVNFLGQAPGNWDCELRKEGKVWRKLSWHVNEKGLVDPDPSQEGQLTIPDVVPIQIKFGKDAPDVRVKPDAIKKSAGFGRPWPKGPPKDLPKASGLPDMK